MIGLDTRTIIDISKSNPDIKLILGKIDEPLVSTIINYQELMFGLDFDKKEHKEEGKYYEEFFDNIFLLSLTKESSKKASEIFRGLQKKGADVGRFDSMIAGILLQNGIRKIITRNVKHFSKIKEIELITY